MNIALTHAQRRALLSLDPGDVILHPAGDGIYRGDIVIEHHGSGDSLLLSPDGRIERATWPRGDEDVVVGPVHIDPTRREVRVNGELLTTTQLEFDLMLFLARDPDRVVPRHVLMTQVWHFPVGSNPLTRTLDAHALRIRKKLTAAGAPKYVTAIRGVGYRFNP